MCEASSTHLWLMWPLVHGQRLQPVVLLVLFHRVTPTHAWQHGNVLCMTYTVKVDIEVNGITRILLYIIPSIDHHLQETIPGIQYCVKTACIKLFTTHYIHVCACTAALWPSTTCGTLIAFYTVASSTISINQINERMRPSMSAYKRDVCNNWTVRPFPLTHACL